jgi:uncharacterized membrane protein (UPF0127 family)/Flp pilus assembly protein protease CpaA
MGANLTSGVEGGGAAGGGLSHARIETAGGSRPGSPVCPQCEVADNPWRRFLGLMGRKGLGDGQGLLLSPAPSIHTFFMRFPIDAVFLNAEMQVVGIRQSLRPWRLAGARGARSVLELPAGQAERVGLEVGDALRLVMLEQAVAEPAGAPPLPVAEPAAPATVPAPPAAAPEVTPLPPEQHRSPGFGELSLPYRWGGIVTALTLAALALAHFGTGAHGWIAATFAATLAILAAIDLEHRVIPNRIVLPVAAAVLVAQIASSDRTFEWLAAGAGAALVMLLPALIRPGSVGMGDVKLGLLLGFGLGKQIIPGLMLGSFAAFPVALYIVAKGGADVRKQSIPFGPFLATGGILALFLT